MAFLPSGLWAARSSANCRTDISIVEMYVTEILGEPILPRDVEVFLIKKAQEGDIEARNQVVRANLRFVLHLAKRYSAMGTSYEDLIQDGNMGLIKAVYEYDESFDVKFSSYARYHIIGAFQESLRKNRVIRIADSISDLIPKWFKKRVELKHQLNRTPSDDEIGEALGVDKSKQRRLQLALKCQTEPISGDSVSAPPAPEIEQDFSKKAIDAIKGLEPYQVDVIEKRFGLHGEPAKKLREIGDEYGVTRECIRQIEVDALEYLRWAVTRRKIG